MESHHLRPPEAEDAAEFVAAMRALRVRSGYSFRVLERRAANLGEVLPTSTLNSALSRSTLPREQIVVAFVRACGGDEETAAAWARVRADLAAAELDAAIPDTEPKPGEPVAAEPEPEQPAEPAEPAAAEPEKAAAVKLEQPKAAEPEEPKAAGPEQPAAAEPERPVAPEPPPAPVAPAVSTPAVVRRSRAVAVVSGVAAVVLAAVLVAVLTNSPPSAAPNAAPTPTTTTTPTTTAETTTSTTTSTAPAENLAPAPQHPNPQPPAPTTVPTTENRPQPPPNRGPRDGIQRIRLGHTGLCVGEGQEAFTTKPRIVLGQYDCATATPPTELERLPDGSFRIKLHNIQYGVGCATVDYEGTDVGVLLAGDTCADRADQKFTLEPVAAGYRLHSVPGARYCIGVYGGSRQAGVQLIQDPCDGGAHQIFQLG